MMAKRAGAKATEAPGSHAIYISNPHVVAELILKITRQSRRFPRPYPLPVHHRFSNVLALVARLPDPAFTAANTACLENQLDAAADGNEPAARLRLTVRRETGSGIEIRFSAPVCIRRIQETIGSAQNDR